MRTDQARLPALRAVAPAGRWTLPALVAWLVVVSLALGLPAPLDAKTDGRACRGADRSPAKIGSRAAERAVACLFNRHRPRPDALSYHRELAEAAARHNRRMLAQNCFAHRCPGERSTSGRVRLAGYRDGSSRWGVGEVIGFTSRSETPRDIVRDWIRSGPHRSVIRNSRYKHVGVAVSAGTPRSGRGFTYTANLGYRRG